MNHTMYEHGIQILHWVKYEGDFNHIIDYHITTTSDDKGYYLNLLNFYDKNNQLYYLFDVEFTVHNMLLIDK